MSSPVRLQLSRRKGFDLQALSRTTNGMPVVRVCRPGTWGNPFPAAGLHWEAVAIGFRADAAGRQAAAVELYRRWLGLSPLPGPQMSAPDDGGVLVFEDGSEATVAAQARRIASFAVGAGLGADIDWRRAPPAIADLRAALGGHNLACWCKLSDPCHADVLLSLAAG